MDISHSFFWQAGEAIMGIYNMTAATITPNQVYLPEFYPRTRSLIPARGSHPKIHRKIPESPRRQKSKNMLKQ
jgi:hypothetical protein